MATADSEHEPVPYELLVPQSKKVLVYCNGDPFFPGKNFVITSRYVATFDSFLSELTQRIDPPFGAVRSLYTPEEGHRVWDLASLQHRAVYVAAGTEGFKKLDYLQIGSKKPQQKTQVAVRPVVHSRIIVESRWKRYRNESCTINLHRDMLPQIRGKRSQEMLEDQGPEPTADRHTCMSCGLVRLPDISSRHNGEEYSMSHAKSKKYNQKRYSTISSHLLSEEYFMSHAKPEKFNQDKKSPTTLHLVKENEQEEVFQAQNFRSRSKETAEDKHLSVDEVPVKITHKEAIHCQYYGKKSVTNIPPKKYMTFQKWDQKYVHQDTKLEKVNSKTFSEEEILSQYHGKKMSADSYPLINVTRREWDPKDAYQDRKTEKVPSKSVPMEEIPFNYQWKRTSAHSHPSIDLMHKKWKPKDVSQDKELEKVPSETVPKEEVPSQCHRKEMPSDSHTLIDMVHERWESKDVHQDRKLEEVVFKTIPTEEVPQYHEKEMPADSHTPIDVAHERQKSKDVHQEKELEEFLSKTVPKEEVLSQYYGEEIPVDIHTLVDVAHERREPKDVYQDRKLEEVQDTSADHGFLLHKDLNKKYKEKSLTDHEYELFVMKA
nr:PREDICTED: doublecortin domain-containing protein 2C [Latimeria chalumnae]|eukprot:XP_014350412.1 PREDICTED: doublecortin domain-containing protein 2C [Latimeria chalumnae]